MSTKKGEHIVCALLYIEYFYYREVEPVARKESHTRGYVDLVP